MLCIPLLLALSQNVAIAYTPDNSIKFSAADETTYQRFVRALFEGGDWVWSLPWFDFVLFGGLILLSSVRWLTIYNKHREDAEKEKRQVLSYKEERIIRWKGITAAIRRGENPGLWGHAIRIVADNRKERDRQERERERAEREAWLTMSREERDDLVEARFRAEWEEKNEFEKMYNRDKYRIDKRIRWLKKTRPLQAFLDESRRNTAEEAREGAPEEGQVRRTHRRSSST